jgi:hypothetical protein
MPAQAEQLEIVRASLDAARATWGENGEAEIATGLAYGDSEPVVVYIRKRGRRYDLHDDGAAVRKAGKARGWLQLAEEVVAAEGFNVNRTGVVFVPAFEGRDLASLAARLAGTSLDVHAALLELRDSELQ